MYDAYEKEPAFKFAAVRKHKQPYALTMAPSIS